MYKFIKKRRKFAAAAAAALCIQKSVPYTWGKIATMLLAPVTEGLETDSIKITSFKKDDVKVSLLVK